MPHQYEFGVTTIEIDPGAADLTADEMNLALAGPLQGLGVRLAQIAQQNEPGDWQIVSHSITRIDRHLVVTFLMRRES